MPLRVVRRKGTDMLYIRGTVRGIRCFETCGTTDRDQANAYRAKREADLYEESVFGPRAVVSFGRAALSYLEFEPRSERTKDYVARLVKHFGGALLNGIDQAAADRAVSAVLARDAEPATKIRSVYSPLAAILNHAADRKWCDRPKFRRPQPPKGKTRWLSPAEAQALHDAAAPHLRPLLHFILCTGARLSEALDLDWADVDLPAEKVVFRDTKNGKDRAAALPGAAVLTLANLPGREGRVFRRDDGEPYVDLERQAGGQIKTGFRAALRRAGLAHATPHDLRHTWATWFYAVTKDPLLLKAEGGWASLAMVERYAHLMPSELAAEVARIWGASHPRIGLLAQKPGSGEKSAGEQSDKIRAGG